MDDKDWENISYVIEDSGIVAGCRLRKSGQVRVIQHDRLNEYSGILSNHSAHLDSHDSHLAAHDRHLAILTQADTEP